MKILIGDIGNTLTKLCLISEKFKIIKEYNSKIPHEKKIQNRKDMFK